VEPPPSRAPTNWAPCEPRRRAGGPPRPRPRPKARRPAAGPEAPPAADDAAHALREECHQLRTEAAAREEQLRRLAARPARTEEAAKRALAASNPGAKGGVAAQLPAAEHVVDVGRSALLALRRQLVAATKAAAGHR
jgi:hypothetical protein